MDNVKIPASSSKALALHLSKPMNSKGSKNKRPPQKSPSYAYAGSSRIPHRAADEKPHAQHPGLPPDRKSSKSKAPSTASRIVGSEDHTTSPRAPGRPATGFRLFPPTDHAGLPQGFHNLERRTIVLADGSVRSYFALPPDDPVADKFLYGRPRFGLGPEPLPGLGFDKNFPPPPEGRFGLDDFRQPPPYARGPSPPRDYWDSHGFDGHRDLSEGGGGSSFLKRKFGEEDELLRHRQHVVQSGNHNGIPLAPTRPGGDRKDYLRSSTLDRDHHDELRSSKQVKIGGESLESSTRKSPLDEVPAVVWVVQDQALRRAFLKFAKTINENPFQRKKYLDDGKSGHLHCIVCGRASKDVSDMHGLIMHTYNSRNTDLRVDHLGLHKALCVLMGWDYTEGPDDSKAYQLLSADDAQANRDDLIIWPPTVLIHNTSSGKKKDGRIEGMGNKEMDYRLQELGYGNGKAKSIYGKEGHTGVTMVKFPSTQNGLKEAERLAEYFEKDNHGRKGWARVQASQLDDAEKNPAILKADEKTGEKIRVLYGHLATVSDLHYVDPDLRINVMRFRNTLLTF